MLNKAVIAGASGLIGSNLLPILLNESYYDQVLLLVRKPLPIEHPKLKQLVIDFDKLDDYADEINGHAIFSCLGTTLKKTPDKAIYRRIDHDYPVKLAEIGAKKGIEQYHLVSAIGANDSASNFYIKIKGETERDVANAGMKCVHIYQPSFITGDRKEFRLAEKILLPIFKVFNIFMVGGLKKYRSIAASTIAMAMYKQSMINQDGVFVHPSDQIKKLA